MWNLGAVLSAQDSTNAEILQKPSKKSAQAKPKIPGYAPDTVRIRSGFGPDTAGYARIRPDTPGYGRDTVILAKASIPDTPGYARIRSGYAPDGSPGYGRIRPDTAGYARIR